MSLDYPKICEFCGENIHGYGHQKSCRMNDPESEVCSRCRCNSAFEYNDDELIWVSVCCGAPAMPTDVPSWMED